MDPHERIERFKKMTEADPDNELGHFSLGKALAEVGRLEEALPSLERVLALNAGYSKAYHVLAQALVKLGQRERAIETLHKGVGVAAERGDIVPRDAMVKMLSNLGETPPQFPGRRSVSSAESAGSDFTCSRCGRPSQRMEKQPFKGELGTQVWNHVCQGCWREWVSMGTMVINEMGLQMTNPQAQQAYDEHMIEYLQLQR